MLQGHQPDFVPIWSKTEKRWNQTGHLWVSGNATSSETSQYDHKINHLMTAYETIDQGRNGYKYGYIHY